MRLSGQPLLVARSQNPDAVEGYSEIDVILSTKRHLFFIEAKLDSDISTRTTYDPMRNQIVRNIDCLLESAQGREPFFWMFVRDAAAGRLYSQLMDGYRRDPETLIKQLPHRHVETLKKIARSLSTITWKDLGRSVLEMNDGDNDELSAVKQELARRLR